MTRAFRETDAASFTIVIINGVSECFTGLVQNRHIRAEYQAVVAFRTAAAVQTALGFLNRFRLGKGCMIGFKRMFAKFGGLNGFPASRGFDEIIVNDF